jgi:mannose-6-phosphate isomerase-like protein (cupin superfamily)
MRLETSMNNELDPAPWVASPEKLAEQAWEYCRIRHFPRCGEAFRVSYVRIGPDDEAKVVTHEHSSELVCVLSGEALALAGETKHKLKTNDVVFLPKNTAHAFAAIGGEAVLLVVHAPAVSPNADHIKSAAILARP